MQKPIRVRARSGVLVPVPRHGTHGAVVAYVGRSVDHGAHKSSTDHEELYPMLKDASEYSIERHGYDVFKEVERAVRQGDLLPADADTAKRCGVKFGDEPMKSAPAKGDGAGR